MVAICPEHSIVVQNHGDITTFLIHPHLSLEALITLPSPSNHVESEVDYSLEFLGKEMNRGGNSEVAVTSSYFGKDRVYTSPGAYAVSILAHLDHSSDIAVSRLQGVPDYM